MKFNSMMLTLLLFATLAGCASLDANTDGDGNSGGYVQSDIERQMAADSQGGDA